MAILVFAGYFELNFFEVLLMVRKGTKNDIKITQTRSYPLKDIAVPTLIVHGTNDPLVPFKEHGKRLATEISWAQFLVAEGGEHVTIFTHRREVQAKVFAFLQELNLVG